MREQFTKSVTKKLQELVLEAHEKALRGPLEKLGAGVIGRFTWSSYEDCSAGHLQAYPGRSAGRESNSGRSHCHFRERCLDPQGTNRNVI